MHERVHRIRFGDGSHSPIPFCTVCIIIHWCRWRRRRWDGDVGVKGRRRSDARTLWWRYRGRPKGDGVSWNHGYRCNIGLLLLLLAKGVNRDTARTDELCEHAEGVGRHIDKVARARVDLGLHRSKLRVLEVQLGPSEGTCPAAEA